MFVTKAIFILIVSLAATGTTMADREIESAQAPNIGTGYRMTQCVSWKVMHTEASMSSYRELECGKK